MSIDQSLPKYEGWCYQKCPFCGRENTIVVNGMVIIDKISREVPDCGYSFCNCKNIWYTNWRNIWQDMYTQPNYVPNHEHEKYRLDMEKLFRHYLDDLKKHGNGGKKFLDLGSVVDHLTSYAEVNGYEPTGLDIIDRNSRYKFIVADFDDYWLLKDKYDVIWSNHFFEHLHYPLQALKKCYDMLNDGGLLFVAMPDPFQINWDDPKVWISWALRQHHIMWDMDSFCDEAEALGLKTILKVRNMDVRPLKDYHLLFKK